MVLFIKTAVSAVLRRIPFKLRCVIASAITVAGIVCLAVIEGRSPGEPNAQVSCCSSQVFCAGRASRLEASEPMEVEELAAAEEAVVATAAVGAVATDLQRMCDTQPRASPFSGNSSVSAWNATVTSPSTGLR